MDKVHNKLQKKLLHLQATAKTGIWNSMYRKQLEVNATKQCQLTESTSMRDTLHWLSHPQPVIYKLCLLTYKCLHGLAPQYLSQLFPLLHDLNLSLALSLSLTLDPCWRLCWQLWFFTSLHAPLWQFFIWHNWNGCYCYYYYYFMIQVVFIPGVKNKQLKKISLAATGPDLRQWNRRNRWSVLSWNAGCHTLRFANIITIYYYY